MHVLAYVVTSHNSGEHVFSVTRGPCSVHISEPNSEAGSCRSVEEYKEYNKVREGEFSMGDNHGKLLAEEELEDSL
jgi:hypothetical protein